MFNLLKLAVVGGSRFLHLPALRAKASSLSSVSLLIYAWRGHRLLPTDGSDSRESSACWVAATCRQREHFIVNGLTERNERANGLFILVVSRVGRSQAPDFSLRSYFGFACNY